MNSIIWTKDSRLTALATLTVWISWRDFSFKCYEVSKILEETRSSTNNVHKSIWFLHGSFSSRNCAALSLSQRGTRLLLLAPPHTLAPALSTVHKHSWWQQYLECSMEHPTIFTTSQNCFEMCANMTGAIRRRLSVFCVASDFALALYPSVKPLCAKSVARQGCTVSLSVLWGLIL